jgi:hypothetical protein
LFATEGGRKPKTSAVDPIAARSKAHGREDTTVTHLWFCLFEDKFFLSHDDRIGGNSFVNQATCSDDHVVADGHVTQDRNVASHPAVSSNFDLPDFEIRWEGVEPAFPELMLVVVVVHFHAFSKERVFANLDSPHAGNGAMIVEKDVVADDQVPSEELKNTTSPRREFLTESDFRGLINFQQVVVAQIEAIAYSGVAICKQDEPGAFAQRKVRRQMNSSTFVI